MAADPIREAILDGSRSEAVVAAALAALAALESERDEARDALAFAKVGHHDVAEMLVAAEARVTQLEGEVRPLVEASVEAFGAFDGDWDDEEDVSTPGTGITFGMIRRARRALGVVADGGGGRDGE